jgi:hypothetical protein
MNEFLEFLSTANPDNELAYQELQALAPIKKLVRIQGAERKTAVESINIFNDTEERLREFTPNPAMSAELQAFATKLAKMILKAFENLFNPEFYINLADQEVEGAWSASVTLGVLTEEEFNGILEAGTETIDLAAMYGLQDIVEERDAGEALALISNNNEHKIKLSIATQPRNPVDITIQQRFGLTNQDLTNWEDIGAVRGVKHTTAYIAFYESGMIPKSSSDYRELRAVCPLTLGLALVTI